MPCVQAPSNGVSCGTCRHEVCAWPAGGCLAVQAIESGYNSFGKKDEIRLSP